MTSARSFTLAAAVLFATLSVASSSIIKQKSDRKSCSCDCCEVQSHPVLGLQCAYSQTAPTFQSTAPRCDTLCKQDADDSALTATPARETDTERYCFFNCQPKPPIDKTLRPKPGGTCKRFPKLGQQRGAKKSGAKWRLPRTIEGSKEAATKAHFLVSKQKHIEVAAVAIAGRVENGAVDLAGFVAGPAPAAVIAAAPTNANEAESAAVPLAAVAAAPAVAPAPAPAPAVAVAGALAAKPPPPVAKWASVSPVVNQQVVTVVKWAKEAQAAAGKSFADAAKITAAGTKAGGSMTTVLAEVGNAKAAMDNANAKERRVSLLYDRLYKKAKDAALEQVPAILKELRKKAQDEADKKAKTKAKVFEKNMQAKGMAMSLKAAKVYTDQMAAAGKSAAAYAKLGDGLIAQSAAAQVNSGLASGGANAMMMTGQMGEAQKMYQNSRSDMNTALALNAQATKMYDTANTITAQMPAYAGQAAQAGFHAQVMYDPKAVAPPPPLV